MGLGEGLPLCCLSAQQTHNPPTDRIRPIETRRLFTFYSQHSPSIMISEPVKFQNQPPPKSHKVSNLAGLGILWKMTLWVVSSLIQLFASCSNGSAWRPPSGKETAAASTVRASDGEPNITEPPRRHSHLTVFYNPITQTDICCLFYGSGWILITHVWPLMVVVFI